MSATRRTSFTVPIDLYDQLDYCSRKMRLSKSAFLSALLSESLPGLFEIFSTLPDDLSEATDADARRFRGVTADVVSKQVGDILRAMGGSDD